MSVFLRCVVCGRRHWEADSSCPRFLAEMKVAQLAIDTAREMRLADSQPPLPHRPEVAQ